MKNTLLRRWIFGVVLWLIPMVVSFAFYDQNRTLVVSLDLFKSVMVVVSILSGSWLLVRHLRAVDQAYREGWLTGITWLAINLALDLLVLIPMSHMPLTDYFSAIGLRYLSIPIVAIAMGRLAHKES
ncbi:MAG: hypothetical protein K1X47_00860 [Cyclobacteriaceae bacterium]|nr:hypothetical protein [Cyclobacteriaceae bacterium]